VLLGGVVGVRFGLVRGSKVGIWWGEVRLLYDIDSVYSMSASMFMQTAS
jgi:hypothetical protein